MENSLDLSGNAGYMTVNLSSLSSVCMAAICASPHISTLANYLRKIKKTVMESREGTVVLLYGDLGPFNFLKMNQRIK